MFEVEYSNRATKFLKNCDKNLAERVLEKIEKFSTYAYNKFKEKNNSM